MQQSVKAPFTLYNTVPVKVARKNMDKQAIIKGGIYFGNIEALLNKYLDLGKVEKEQKVDFFRKQKTLQVSNRSPRIYMNKTRVNSAQYQPLIDLCKTNDIRYNFIENCSNKNSPGIKTITDIKRLNNKHSSPENNKFSSDKQIENEAPRFRRPQTSLYVKCDSTKTHNASGKEQAQYHKKLIITIDPQKIIDKLDIQQIQTQRVRKQLSQQLKLYEEEKAIKLQSGSKIFNIINLQKIQIIKNCLLKNCKMFRNNLIMYKLDNLQRNYDRNRTRYRSLTRPISSETTTTVSRIKRSIAMRLSDPNQLNRLRTQVRQETNMDRFELGEVIGSGTNALVRKALDKVTGLQKNYSVLKISGHKDIRTQIVDEYAEKVQPQERGQNTENDETPTYSLSSDDSEQSNMYQLNHGICWSSLTKIISKLSSQQSNTRDGGKNIVPVDCSIDRLLSSEECCASRSQIGKYYARQKQSSQTDRLWIQCGSLGRISTQCFLWNSSVIIKLIVRYMAPEIVQKEDYNGKSADVWALGVLLYVILHGYFPFTGILITHINIKGKFESDLFQAIKLGQFRNQSFLTTQVQELLNKTLKVNHLDRLTVNQILNDDWLQL